ncbi:MAG: hypothetical protein G01um10148_592 [Parcubacteria group bacterium Gr01-1014_8]|nr:MAG: hypothetical protein G01um10148_592 [Parcubacteria group bacterium Gr01-1014_8]
MSENGGNPKKPIDLSAERLKKLRPKNLLLRTDVLVDALGLPPETFAPPQGLKELSLSEAHEFASEIVKKYSDRSTFMQAYTEELYPDDPKAEQRAAESVEGDLNEKREIVGVFTTEGMRQTLSYSKADSRYYPIAFTFVTAEAFLNRFPNKPQE